MKTKFRKLLNRISVTIIFLSLIVLFVYILYSSDLKRRQNGYHRDLGKFILTLIDERVQALDVSEASVLIDIVTSISDYFDVSDAARVVVFNSTSGKIIYPYRAVESSVQKELFDAAGAGIEGEIGLDDRFGYYFKYPELDISFFIYTYASDLFFIRNQLIYIITGFLVFFGFVIFLVDRGLWRRLNLLLCEMKVNFEKAFFLKEKLVERIEEREGVEFEDVLQSYNKMALRAGSLFKRMESKIGALVQKNDNLRKMIVLYKNYLNNDELVKLNEKNIADLESKRHNIASLCIELVNFLDPVDELYPQVITQELSSLYAFVKRETAKNGGIINFSYGYFINAVYGVPAHDKNLLLHAVEGSKRVLDWVNERNNSEKNISGVRWEVKIGLSSGTAVTGLVGDNFIVLGNVVENSIKMLDYSRYYGVTIVTDSVDVLKQLKKIMYRKLDLVSGSRANNGTKKTIYEIFLKAPDRLEDAIKLYYHGLEMFFDGKYDMAIYEFKKVNTIFNGDNPSRIFLERCERFLKS